ncbi:hypothetical protein MGA5115_03114 [Marinomonas gallaica]|uniref:Methyltransferase type 11 domain-containing protein n=1 Tax=Marinomonas gallaica TaxID=1806667 RepID=A0A1C3JUT4_9GAMM|nr:class I SAM-dependent methyltransferase [Marinomonas gallaica]SBT18953.1 hypothetical protein MGA5115_03114 [Marinomonas gallaica]SBT21908.1 hypothetical protein MGA5116_02518 [Marinomonas gallaica]
MTMSAADLKQLQPEIYERSAKRFLNVGSGHAGSERLPECFRFGDWQQIRLDINPKVKPDVLADVTDLSNIEDHDVDAVYSSHNLEHLHQHQVPKALSEIHRVLKPNGFVLLTMPDIKAVAKWVLEGKLMETIYESPMGPIRPIDIMFGHQGAVEQGDTFMAHKTAFDANSLAHALNEEGFKEVRVMTDKYHNLWGYGVKF